MDTREIREDWLAGNAVVVFVAALLIAQHWERTYTGYELPFINFTVPNFADSAVFAIVASLFALSIVLVLASTFTPLRHWAFREAVDFSPLLWWLILFAFLFGWLQTLQGLPTDQWWSPVPRWLGIGFFFFIMYRILGGASIVRRIGKVLVRQGRKATACPTNMNANSRDSNVDQKSEEGYGAEILARVSGFLDRSHIPESGAFWMVATVVVAATEVVVAAVFWDWLSGSESGSTTVRNIGIVVAGSVALLLAMWRALVADKQARAAQDQTATAQQSLLNERYQKGAEMLGSAVLSVRLGGICALRRLAEEHPRQYYVQVTRLFCAFVRFPARDQSLESGQAPIRQGSLLGIRQDVEAVMDAIGSRDEMRTGIERREDFTLDLRGADLTEAQISEADLSKAKFHHANLSSANFANTDLTDAILSYADLSKAQFRDVDFTGTRLWHANLSGAMLQGAEMPRMSFDYVSLCGANLGAANLSGAIFQDANVANAWLERANLCGATFVRADLSRARFDRSDLSGAEFMDTDLSGANFYEANISGSQFSSGGSQPSKGLTQTQLDQAQADPDNPPELVGVLDARTGEQLIWRGRPPHEKV